MLEIYFGKTTLILSNDWRKRLLINRFSFLFFFLDKKKTRRYVFIGYLSEHKRKRTTLKPSANTKRVCQRGGEWIVYMEM